MKRIFYFKESKVKVDKQAIPNIEGLGITVLIVRSGDFQKKITEWIFTANWVTCGRKMSHIWTLKNEIKDKRKKLLWNCVSAKENDCAKRCKATYFRCSVADVEIHSFHSIAATYGNVFILQWTVQGILDKQMSVRVRTRVAVVILLNTAMSRHAARS